MNSKRTEAFRALHVKGAPLVLYNIWDAGTAVALVKAGAPAAATGSASVASAMGFDDGEDLPLDLVLANATRICAAVPTTPVSIDFEGGYADAPDEVAANVARLVATGAAGMNLEDGKPRASGMFTLDEQIARLAATRAVDAALFINARTDLFLQAPADAHDGLIDDAARRAKAYAKAGADGFFVPGLTDAKLIGDLCSTVSLPVNVMMMPGAPELAELASLGASRVSFGPGPYTRAMARLTEDYLAAIA